MAIDPKRRKYAAHDESLLKAWEFVVVVRVAQPIETVKKYKKDREHDSRDQVGSFRIVGVFHTTLDP